MAGRAIDPRQLLRAADEQSGRVYSEDDEEFNPAAPPSKRKEKKAERDKRMAERLLKNFLEYRRQPNMLRGTQPDDETLCAVARSLMAVDTQCEVLYTAGVRAGWNM